jgi:hypothetical protein
MKQEILTALNGDEDQYYSIMQKTQQSDIVENRNAVFLKLITLGFTQKQIAAHWELSRSGVSVALSRHTQNKRVGYSGEISATLMDEIYKSIPKDKSGLIIEALRLKGYSFRDIGTYLNINFSTCRSRMEVATEQRDFEERRKRIVKFN